jgi:hypothetical protein
MRRHAALVIAILVNVFVVASALSADAATRLRLYRGVTSQDHRITFVVAKSDAGRFVREMGAETTFTCEDQTTQDVGWGFGFGRRQVPITDRAFSFDEVSQIDALHLAGELGSLHGQGTLTLAFPALTPDEQAQVCTTGDLTWEVDYVRTITPHRIAPGATTVHIDSDARGVLPVGHA